MDEEYYILCMERVPIGLYWWNASEYGYTGDLARAGKFSKERAYDICRMSGYADYPVPVTAFEGRDDDETKDR